MAPQRNYFSFAYDPNTGYYTITNLNSGKVLDAANGRAENGANVQQYNSNGTLAQRWIIEKQSDGSYVIKSAVDQNYVLDITSARIANGSNIQLYRTNDTEAQKFNLVSV